MIKKALRVYPACAGIDLPSLQPPFFGLRLPRMRGDRPWQGLVKNRITGFTPHARGSTPSPYSPTMLQLVYPACAGIDLT